MHLKLITDLSGASRRRRAGQGNKMRNSTAHGREVYTFEANGGSFLGNPAELDCVSTKANRRQTVLRMDSLLFCADNCLCIQFGRCAIRGGFDAVLFI